MSDLSAKDIARELKETLPAGLYWRRGVIWAKSDPLRKGRVSCRTRDAEVAAEWLRQRRLLAVADQAYRELWASFLGGDGKGEIYFVRAANSGLVKIGYTTDIRARLRALQQGHPERLDVVLRLAGTRGHERACHALFALQHVRGEWFLCQGVLKRFLDEMALEPKETA